MSNKSFDAIKAIKLENDKSAGNLIDVMPVKVETLKLIFLSLIT